MRFIHFEGQESVNLEKVRHIWIKDNMIVFYHDSFAMIMQNAANKTVFHSTTEWTIPDKDKRQKVYDEILVIFSHEITIEV